MDHKEIFWNILSILENFYNVFLRKLHQKNISRIPHKNKFSHKIF